MGKLKRFVRTNPVLAEMITLGCYATGHYKRQEIDRLIASWVPDCTPERKKTLTRDIIRSGLRSRMTPEEYFQFGFEGKKEADRASFLSHTDRRAIVRVYQKRSDHWRVLKDKYGCWELWRQWYGRDAVQVNQQEDLPAFVAFAAKHPCFVLKKLDASHGDGVHAVDLVQDGRSPEEFFQQELAGSQSIVEEMIRQSPEMAAFHPQSVNTVRIVSLLDKDRFNVVFTLVRMGFGGSFVDNACAGGIIAAVDAETGEIVSEGLRETVRASYQQHPETGARILGARIPKWKELLEITEAAARVAPDIPWIGWDFALTDQGWVIVEANYTPSFVGVQMTTGKGLRPRIMELTGLDPKCLD